MKKWVLCCVDNPGHHLTVVEAALHVVKLIELRKARRNGQGCSYVNQIMDCEEKNGPGCCQAHRVEEGEEKGQDVVKFIKSGHCVT